MRLIDADRLSEIIYENVSASYEDSREAKEECLREIEAAPAIDAVPVARCKDCRCFERQGEYNGGISYGYCYHWDYEQGGEPNMVDGNDFCSYGEKKDGAD